MALLAHAPDSTGVSSELLKSDIAAWGRIAQFFSMDLSTIFCFLVSYPDASTSGLPARVAEEEVLRMPLCSVLADVLGRSGFFRDTRLDQRTRKVIQEVDMFSLEVLEVVGGLSPQASQAMMQDGATLGGLLRVWKAEGRRRVVEMFRLEGVPTSG